MRDDYYANLASEAAAARKAETDARQEEQRANLATAKSSHSDGESWWREHLLPEFEAAGRVFRSREFHYDYTRARFAGPTYQVTVTITGFHPYIISITRPKVQVYRDYSANKTGSFGKQGMVEEDVSLEGATIDPAYPCRLVTAIVRAFA